MSPKRPTKQYKKELRTAVIVGALAGIAPQLINLVGVDARLIVSNFDQSIFIGYLIKSLGLMVLGGFVVFVNSEIDLKKAFQLGIMAPAFIVGALNANVLSNTKTELQQLEQELKKERRKSSTKVKLSDQPRLYSEGTIDIRFSWFALAQADATVINEGKGGKLGSHNKPSSLDKIWYGISGNRPNQWFVVVGSHKGKVSAKAQAKEIAAKGFNTRVYPPVANSQYYTVTIGSYISLEEARKLKEIALNEGLQQDTYLSKRQP